jgi:hypothetical protein
MQDDDIIMHEDGRQNLTNIGRLNLRNGRHMALALTSILFTLVSNLSFQLYK